MSAKYKSFLLTTFSLFLSHYRHFLINISIIVTTVIILKYSELTFRNIKHFSNNKNFKMDILFRVQIYNLKFNTIFYYSYKIK